MTRDYQAELALYAKEVAPTAGWPAMVELRDGLLTLMGRQYDPNAGNIYDPPRALPACVAAVALLESFLMDWLAKSGLRLEAYPPTWWTVVKISDTRREHIQANTRLLALIAAYVAVRKEKP